MPSRIIRESLLESDRWLGLAHPVERLAYIVLLLSVDDLGTAEASNGQLMRLWREPCNLKGIEDAQRLLQALFDADLARIYTVDEKRYVFVPRFRQRFRARTFRCPPPPENLLRDEPEILENIRQINNRVREMTGNGLTDAGQLAVNGQTVAPVGVGVVDGAIPMSKRATQTPKSFEITAALKTWAGKNDIPLAILQAETEKFLDHHRSKGNTFKDWDAAWRKWMRNMIDWSKNNNRNTKPATDIYTSARKAAGGVP